MGAILRPPMSNLAARAINETLHGRSVYRPVDVPGHNVFDGYSEWETNGGHGVGDAIDFAAAPREPVLALGDATQTLWRNDATCLEYVQLQGVTATGQKWRATYAHINATHEATGIKITAGETVGLVRGDLSEPHLHFELWMETSAGSGRMASVSGHDPDTLQGRLLTLFGGDNAEEPSEWAKAYVERAKQLGISDGTRPHDNVTREEAMTMMVRLHDLLKT